jgi:exodeoxyribonuclease VII small subunit
MAKKASQTPPKSFEDALRELEQILQQIEDGQVGLEESLVQYERGNFLIQHCRLILGKAEKQIELLAAENLSAGTPLDEGVEPTATPQT